ncbi:PBECR2 nuclease fold domain-containing protein [Helicobacter himalayensis]|uniref:putative barnase/colicin E5 family endoribonuclease n=1 Tax=Helicobacter himalayensis TaxID=1591088 RepID=UPI0008362707|nr:PBECR2 nuclease fold domain-containing protein [Helicobacter himalayensis]
MLCLNNIQKALAELTNSKTTLPDVKELLSAQGYTGIQKGEEFISLLSDLLDKTAPLRMAQPQELNAELFTNAMQKDAKLWIDNATPYLNESLGLDNAKITMRGSVIKHILKRHGAQSELVKKSGQPPITTQDLSDYAYIVNNADLQGINTDKSGQKFLISGKQINGYHIIVESISTKDNELKLKTMYKEKGKLEDNAVIKAERLAKPHFITEPLILQTQRQGKNLDSSSPLYSESILTQIPQDLKQSQDLLSFALPQGKKILIQKDESTGLFTIESNYTPNPKSYDEAKINQALEDFANEELEEKLTQKFTATNTKKALVSTQDADEIVRAEIQEAQREARAQSKEAELKAQIKLAQEQKDASLGKGVDEVRLSKGEAIPYQPLRDTRIILKDDVPPFEASFAIVNLDDIKPNFTKSNTQGRVVKQEAVIKSIINDFKPELLFFREGGVDGLPIITQDGLVISGNHRSQAIREILSDSTYSLQAEAYKEATKDFLGVELQEGQAVVRVIKDNVRDDDILKLAFASNVGRESTMGEKALSNLSLYKDRIKSLPDNIESQDVEELKSLVAKHIDVQSKGLDTFNANLALLSNLAKNTENTDIIGALDSIKGDSELRVKIINMFVDNAGSFHNLTHSKILQDLELREHLANAIGFVGRAEESRAQDFAYLNREIDGFLSLSNEGKESAFLLDSNKINNLTAQALGLSLAKFSRQENPSGVLYEVLKDAPKELEKLTQPTLFGDGKALSEVNIYDFIEYLISTGQASSESSNLIKNLRALEAYAKANPHKVKSFTNEPAPKTQAETTTPDTSADQSPTQNQKSNNHLDNTHPTIHEDILQDFGTNYPEFYHKGAEALKHLLSTKEGQVQGAFYRKDLEELSGNGDISLVWGEITDKANHKGYGLAHIIEKHPEISAELLNDIIEKGEVRFRNNEAIQIIKDNYKVVLKPNWKGERSGNWIVTAYENEKGLSISSKPFTKADSLALNSNDTLPLSTLEQPKPKTTREILNEHKEQGLSAKETLKKIKENKELKETINAQEQEAQELWLKTFNLKSLDEEFIPNFEPEVKEALSPILKNENIHLGKGSLVKLQRENRLKYLDRIKPTLEAPDLIIKQQDGALIFAKDFNDKKHFTSISRQESGKWIVVSNAPKSENGLQNKIKVGGVKLYQAGGQINAHAPYEDIAKSNTLLDTHILPQKTQILDPEELKEREILEGFKKGANPKSFKEYEAKANAIRQRRKYLENVLEDYKPFLQQAQKELKELVGDSIKVTQESHDPIRYKRNFSKRVKNGEISLADIESFLFWKGNFLNDSVNASIWKSRLFKNLEDLNKQKAIREFFIRKAEEFSKFKGSKEDLEEELAGNNRKLVLLGKVYRERFRGILEAKDLLTSEGLLDSDYIKKYKKYYNDPNKESLQRYREEIQGILKITPNKDFGTNYAEYYHDGKKAVEKLLAEAEDFKARKQKGKTPPPLAEGERGRDFSGQVYGAFYRKDLEELSGNGDISLVWGEITDKANHKGYGLAHIIEKHPEISAELLNDIIEKGEVRFRNNEAIQIIKDNYKVVLKSNWKGERSGNWIVTAYENEKGLSISSKPFTKADSLALNSNDTLPLSTLEQPKPKTTREILNEHKEQGLSAKETLKKIKENKELKETINAQEQEAQELWLKTFNLKSLDEEFIPNFEPEVKEALSPILKDKPLKLNKKDFEKLVNKGRIKYINAIKDTLQNPQIIFKDESGDLIFAKEIDNKLFLTNISREYKEEFLSLSISPKKENTLLNKLEKAQEVYYNKLDSKLRDSSAHKAFTDVLSSANKSNEDILPQETLNIKKQPKPKSEKQKLKENEALVKEIFKNLNETTNTYEVGILGTNEKEIRTSIHKKIKGRDEIRLRKYNPLNDDAFYDYAPPKYFKMLFALEDKFLQIPSELKADKFLEGKFDAIKKEELEQIELFQVRTLYKKMRRNALQGEAYDLNLEDLDALEYIKFNDKINIRELFGQAARPNPSDYFVPQSKKPYKQMYEVTKKQLEELQRAHPNKDFGTNYPEFYATKGRAIEHLLKTKSGQVYGAFYRKDLEELSGNGDISLVWGDSNLGLKHILQRRTEDFLQQGLNDKEAQKKALEFVKSLPSIIEKGKVRKEQTRAFIELDNDLSVIALDYKGEPNNWILTAYKKEDALNPADSHQIKHNTNTSSETRASGEHDILPQESIKKDFEAQEITQSEEFKEEVLKTLETLKKEGYSGIPPISAITKKLETIYSVKHAKELEKIRKNLFDFFVKILPTHPKYDIAILLNFVVRNDPESAYNNIMRHLNSEVFSEKAQKQADKLLQHEEQIKEIIFNPDALKVLENLINIENFHDKANILGSAENKRMQEIIQELHHKKEQPKPKTTREILNEHKEQGLSAKETLKKIKENKELKETINAQEQAQDFAQAHKEQTQPTLF